MLSKHVTFRSAAINQRRLEQDSEKQLTSRLLHQPREHSRVVVSTNQTPWPLVRERTIPTEPPPLVDEL
jgi:hypothetical protein